MGLITLQKGILTFADIVLINISIALAFLLKYDFQPAGIPSGIIGNGVWIILIIDAVKIVIFYLFRLYSSIWKYASIHEMVSVVAAVFIGNAVVMGLLELCGFMIPASVIIVTAFTDVLLVGGLRFAYRSLRRIINRYLFSTMDLRRILIIGNGAPGAILIKELKEHPELKSIPVAIIDDDKSKIGKKINGVPIVGRYADICGVVREKRIDEIIIALPSLPNINEIYSTCLKTNCKIKVLPSYTQLLDGSFVIPRIRNVCIEDLLGREPVDLHIDEISAWLEGKVVLITGGGGSIGSELCRQILLYKPKQLVILDNHENSIFEIVSELQHMYKKINMAAVVATIRDKDRLKEIFNQYRPDVVFHAAAHKHVPLMELNPGEAIKNNVFGTLNLAQCSEEFDVKKFVLISTDKAVNPASVMGVTKRVAELIIQTFNQSSKTEFVAVRFGNVLGSSGSVIPLFKKQIERGGPVTITHPDVSRYFMTIPEAVHLVIQAGAMAEGGEIFVLDMGKPIKIYDLAIKLIELSGYKPGSDIKIQFIGLRPGEKMCEELILEEEGLRATQNNKIFVAKPVLTDYELLRSKIEMIKNVDISDREKAMNYLKDIIMYAKTKISKSNDTRNSQ